MRRQQLARHRAELQIDRSRLDQQVAQMTANVREAAVQATDENILRRQIKAPFDGTVIEVLQNENEWVSAGQSVLRLVQLDELYVDGFLSSAALDSSEIAGCDVTVEVELARGRRVQFGGQIVFVNPLIQAGNKFRARALVSNRKENGHWLLRPGMMASMLVEKSAKVRR
jgi:multidrug efflux pump subunit AcrA (membrane-fusion protein)